MSVHHGKSREEMKKMIAEVDNGIHVASVSVWSLDMSVNVIAYMNSVL